MTTKNADSYTRTWSPDGDIANLALARKSNTNLRRNCGRMAMLLRRQANFGSSFGIHI